MTLITVTKDCSCHGDCMSASTKVICLLLVINNGTLKFFMTTALRTCARATQCLAPACESLQFMESDLSHSWKRVQQVQQLQIAAEYCWVVHV